MCVTPDCWKELVESVLLDQCNNIKTHAKLDAPTCTGSDLWVHRQFYSYWELILYWDQYILMIYHNKPLLPFSIFGRGVSTNVLFTSCVLWIFPFMRTHSSYEVPEQTAKIEKVYTLNRHQFAWMVSDFCAHFTSSRISQQGAVHLSHNVSDPHWVLKKYCSRINQVFLFITFLLLMGLSWMFPVCWE